MITMSNNHPESQNAILPSTEIPNAEPLLQPISEMTAEDIVTATKSACILHSFRIE